MSFHFLCSVSTDERNGTSRGAAARNEEKTGNNNLSTAQLTKENVVGLYRFFSSNVYPTCNRG